MSQSDSTVKTRWRSRLLFVLVFLIGVGLRFMNLGLVRFNYDNAYPMYDALRMLDGRQWLLIGQPTSVFLDNPILMSYIQALPLLIWRSPWAVRIFIALLNTLAIAFVYRTGQLLLDETAGWLAALLFAINPWIIYFSLTTWTQSLMPLLMSMIAWAFLPTLTTDRRAPRHVFIGGLALAVVTQTYLQAMGVLAQIGPLLLLFWRRVPRRALYAGMAILCVAMMLYGAGLWQAREQNFPKIDRFLASETPAHWTREGIDHALRFVTGRDFDYVWARTETAGYVRRRTLSIWADRFLYLALLAGLVVGVLKSMRNGQCRRVSLALGLWFTIPIALTSYTSHPIHIHYLLLSCPAGHLFAAWGLCPWVRHRQLRWLLLLILIGLTLLFGLNVSIARQEVARLPTVAAFDGWDLTASARVGATIRELTVDGASYPIRIGAKGHPAVLSSISATYLKPIKNLDFPNYFVLPGQDPLLYVLVDTPVDASHLGARYENLPDEEIVISDGTQVNFLRVLPYSETAARQLPETFLNWPSEAGLTLLGYTLPTTVRPGELLTGTTYWRVDAMPPGYAEWFVGAFYHLVDEKGRQVINYGKYAQWGYMWQRGDIYVERVAIKLPPDLPSGTYTLNFGLLDSIHGRGFTFIAPDGWFPTASAPIVVGADEK